MPQENQQSIDVFCLKLRVSLIIIIREIKRFSHVTHSEVVVDINEVIGPAKFGEEALRSCITNRLMVSFF